MNYYLSVLKKYAVFSGRARPAEYWYFILFTIIIGLAFSLIENTLIAVAILNGKIGISYIYGLITYVPSFAVGVRRMHDTNRSGWFLIVPIYSLIWLIADGTKGDNKYGSDPKNIKTD